MCKFDQKLEELSDLELAIEKEGEINATARGE
jgi:hypothetical protein